MKCIILFIILVTTFSINSQIVSDSVEYTHIYITDTTKVVKIYKESKDYVNPFGPIPYFSIKIPQTTFFSLSLCELNDSNRITVKKLIYKDYLDKGNYRIENSDMKIDSGIYFYQVDVLDSVYYQKVLFVK